MKAALLAEDTVTGARSKTKPNWRATPGSWHGYLTAAAPMLKRSLMWHKGNRQGNFPGWSWGLAMDRENYLKGDSS